MDRFTEWKTPHASGIPIISQARVSLSGFMGSVPRGFGEVMPRVHGPDQQVRHEADDQ
jgi:hypothetical protein